MEEARREEAADTFVERKIPERQQDKQETQSKKQKFKSHNKKSLSIALYGLRIFVQEWMFHQFEFGTLFYSPVHSTEPCPGRHLSLPSGKDNWCKHLTGDPAYSPHSKTSQPKHKKLLLHFKSGVSYASGWNGTKAGEIWILRNKFPYFLTGNLCMTE